jgi:hypothetical protein
MGTFGARRCRLSRRRRAAVMLVFVRDPEPEPSDGRGRFLWLVMERRENTEPVSWLILLAAHPPGRGDRAPKEHDLPQPSGGPK